MLYKLLPICLTLTQIGVEVPLELKEIGYPRSEIPIQPEDSALRILLELSHRIKHILAAEIVPAILNLDAPRDNALPDFLPDGMPVYPSDRSFCQRIRRQLWERYYRPFYTSISETIASEQVKAGFDLHVFSPQKTTVNTDSSCKPLICLSNNGDIYGEVRQGEGPITCSAEMLRDMRDIFAARFADFSGQVLLNTPIASGYLIRRQGNGEIPWVRLNISRELIFTAEGEVSPKRIENLRDRLETVFVMICKLYEWL